MTVVSNSSPLIVLTKLGYLHLLPSLFGSVLAPSAVHDEVVHAGLADDRADAPTVQTAIMRGEIIIVTMTEGDLAPDVAGLAIGRGERYAIQLALRESAKWGAAR